MLIPIFDIDESIDNLSELPDFFEEASCFGIDCPFKLKGEFKA